MGFDIHGIKPVHIEPAYTGEDSQVLYEYEQASGIYFRNNCWWWRPLWGFICQHCTDILTEDDMYSGSFNDGHKINATKAKKIAIKLEALNLDGTLDQYEENYIDKTYPFNKDNVLNFAEFAKNSGGFQIY